MGPAVCIRSFKSSISIWAQFTALEKKQKFVKTNLLAKIFCAMKFCYRVRRTPKYSTQEIKTGDF